jgi:hypothetical protein
MAENKIDPKFNIHSNYTKVNILNPYRFAVGASYEPETLNYMAAVGIADDSTVYYTGTPQEITGNGFYLAIDTFVKSLKTEGIFSKLKAVYPFIGGTADRHKWNLMNPQDTNEAFRITWYGSGIHSETGFNNNGNSYGDTLFAGTRNTLGNESYGVYSRTQSDGGADMSAISPDRSEMFIRYSGGLYISSQGDLAATSGSTSSLGFFATSRIDSNLRGYGNGIQINITQSPKSRTASSFFLGCRNSGGNPSFYTNREYAYAFIGEGLTSTEIDSYKTAVQQLQTDLGRAV